VIPSYKVIAISVLAILGVVSGVFYYSSRMRHKEVVNSVPSDAKVVPAQGLPTEYTVPVRVLSASSDTGTQVVDIIQFKGDWESLSSINNSLMEAKKSLCAVIDTPQSIAKSYSDTVYGEGKGEAASVDDMIRAMKDKWIYSELKMKTEFLNPHIISVSTVEEYYCGGAYPDHSASGKNFVYSKKVDNRPAQAGLVSPYEISFYTIFSEYEKNMKRVYNILGNKITENSSVECFATEDGTLSAEEYLDIYGEEGNYRDPVSYYITREGVVLQSMFLNHAMGACEPTGLMIKWEEFDGLLDQSFLTLLRQ
jgi:hypothetical protein